MARGDSTRPSNECCYATVNAMSCCIVVEQVGSLRRLEPFSLAHMITGVDVKSRNKHVGFPRITVLKRAL